MFFDPNFFDHFFSTQIFFFDYFSRFFFDMKNFDEKNRWLPISIPNFPKIPKIALRKSCDELKDTENRKPCECVKKTLQVGKIPGNLERTLWMDSIVVSVLRALTHSHQR